MLTSKSHEGGKTSAWTNRDFRRLFGALTVSMLGSEITLLAVPLVAALTLGAGPVEMGLLAAAGRLPTFVVSLLAGVMVDRLARTGPLMIAMDLSRAGLLLLIPGALVVERLSMALLYVVTLLVGAGSVFHEIAQNAYTRVVVPRQQLLDGNSKLQVSYSVGESVGPGLGGLLIQLVTAPPAVVGDAVSYLVSAVFLSRVRTQESRTVRPTRTHPWTEIATDVHALLRDRLLGPWAIWGAAAAVFLGAYEAQYLLFATRELGLNPFFIGLVAVAGGMGAVPAAFLTTWLAERVPVGKSITVALMLCFGFMLAVPLAYGPLPLVLVTLALAKVVQTFAFTVSNVQQWSLRQLVTPPELLGRASAANRFLIGAAETSGAVLSGLVASAFGLRTDLTLAAIGGAVVLLPLIRRPIWRLRRMPTG